ncbi:MAG: tetratricopeptide repeat protein [Planctomycetota bacterium]
MRSSTISLSVGRLLGVTLQTVSLLALVSGPAWADQIIFKDGTSLEVKIKDAGTSEVSFSQAGAVQRRPSHEVEIIFPTFDSTLEHAIDYLKSGDPRKAIEPLERIVDKSKSKEAKPFAQFFLGEAYAALGEGQKAVAAYDECADKYADHFCAPLSLQRAAQMLSGAGAEARFDKLASGKFGDAWKQTGEYGKALSLLGKGDHASARGIFSGLSGSAKDPTMRELAACARAHCDLLGGKGSDAERTFSTIANNDKAPGAARGYAWTGLGLCWKDSRKDDAILALLRGLLLFPSNPQRGLAGNEAAALAKAMNLGGDKRLQSLGHAALPFGDYTGDAPSGELMKRVLQQASAKIVQSYAPKLLASAKTEDEKAELEFAAADAMKVIAKATKDTAMLSAYEKKLEDLQKRYPNFGRSSLAGINQIEAGKARALAVLGQAAEAEEDAKRKQLTTQARGILNDLIKTCEGTIKEQHEKVKELLEKETSFKTSAQIPEELQHQRMRAENERDLTQFFMADAYTTLANTYEEGSEDYKANLDRAKASYKVLTEGNEDRAGTSNDVLRNLAYIGNVETLVAVGDLDEAIGLATDLCNIDLWYDPSQVPDSYKPQVPKDLDHVRQICINAHILLVKALVKAGKGEEALQAALSIDQKPHGKNWKDHPMGLLLVFERAKAMAGAGQGERGAREIFNMLKEAKTLADKGDESARRRFVDACKVLSEISDVTGGEVYTPEIQFYVGFGYFCRGKPELAIAGYKGVLVAARTPQERREWVPKSVREIGNRLFQQERFLEAALAYETVFTEFPDHDLAPDAVRFALSAMKQAVVQLGESSEEGSLTKFYKELQRRAEVTGGAELQAKNTMRDATDAQTRGDWVKAAQTYLEVPATSTDKKTGKTSKVSYYPNAMANAGYCYSLAFKKTKEDKYLKLARESLQKAAKVGGEYGDTESQALACYYLGELELKLRDDPKLALEALRPFDGELGGTKRAVRARYLQAMAHLDLGGPSAGTEAEEYFDKVKDRTKDDFYPTFAYHMTAKLRAYGADLFKANPKDLTIARTWRKKAARYAKLYLDSEDLSKVRDVVLFYLADCLFEGGYYEDALKAYQHCLKSTKAPEIDERAKADDLRALARYDGAQLYSAFCMAQLGQADDAIAALEAVRNVVYLKNTDGKIVGRGVFKTRALSDQTYDFRTPDGRTRKMKVWFTTLDSNGTEVKFFDARPATSDERFQVVKGSDPTKGYQRSDVLSLELVFKRDYFSVSALFDAMWAKYQATKDKNLLAKKGGVTEAINELRYVLKGMDDGSYSSLIAQNQLEPTEFALRQWGADVTYLKLKLERESWGEVLNDIDMMIKLKRLEKAPQSIQDEIMGLKTQAEAHK